MATSSVAVGARRSRADRVARAVDHWILPIYVVGVTAYLILPVAVMILFSFNDPTGRSNLVWRGFSLEAWLSPLGRPGLGEAVRNSLVVAFLSTIIATALGTLIALALTRYQFRGRATTNILIFLPMATPEIVLGASLLTMFVASVQLPIPQGVLFPLNIRTILIAHIMFNISFVVVTVKARLSNFPRNLEEAAMDLGANEWTTFWKVTFPLILPVAVMIMFSFNDPTGRSNLVWREFSLDAWLNPLGRPGLGEAVRNSLVIAVLATLIATALGTLIALALSRYQFRGRATTNVLI